MGQRARDLVKSAAVLAVALVTLEICARIDDYISDGASLLGPHTAEGLYRPSENGKEGNPGARYRKWHMNSLGFRGPEPAGAPRRVVVFGASEMFGLYERGDNEVPRVLERALNRARPAEFEVFNASTPGIRIGRVGALADAMRKAQPHYVALYPNPANYIGVREPLCGKPSQPEFGRPSPLDRLRMWGRAVELARALMPAVLRDLLNQSSIWWSTRNLETIAHVPEETIAAYETDIGCAIAVAYEGGAVPIVLTHASRFRDGSSTEEQRWLVAWRRFYPELQPAGFLDLETRANAAARRAATASSAKLVDVARAVGGDSANFADFVHFTDQGAARMAENIAAEILKAEAGN